MQSFHRRTSRVAPGQSTQTDPIGVAGGLNLYGYAGGDPVNSADPFGLFPTGTTIATVTKARALVATAGAAVRAVAPYAIAGVANVVAGTEFGARIGLPNQYAVGRSGNIQTRASNGQWQSPSANPGVGAGMSANDGVQIAVGVAKGIIHGLGPQDAPKPAANTQLQQAALDATSALVSGGKRILEAVKDAIQQED